jgi:hypothetical protein
LEQAFFEGEAQSVTVNMAVRLAYQVFLRAFAVARVALGVRDVPETVIVEESAEPVRTGVTVGEEVAIGVKGR